jgi:DNA-binding LacI/PurR family transcriptional regulator
VGYEDSELAAHVYPSLTSVRSDPLTWGRTATRVLLDAIDGRTADVELEPARLVVRASTQERRST